MTAIFKKEIHSYFTSMPGYVFLCFFTLITAIFFYVICLSNQIANYSAVLSSTSIIFIIIIPMLTMRLFAEEAKHGTDQLLFTSPVPIWKIVLGKFFSALFLFFVALAITALFPLLISRYGSIPVPQIIGAYAGYFMLGACFISMGLFISAITDNQVIAAVATFTASFILYILASLVSAAPSDRTSSAAFVLIIVLLLAYLIYDATKSFFAALIIALAGAAGAAAMFIKTPELFDGLIAKVLTWFSLMSRFNNFYNGVFDCADIVYYLSFCAAFIVFTIGVIEKRRWS